MESRMMVQSRHEDSVPKRKAHGTHLAARGWFCCRSPEEEKQGEGDEGQVAKQDAPCCLDSQGKGAMGKTTTPRRQMIWQTRPRWKRCGAA